MTNFTTLDSSPPVSPKRGRGRPPQDNIARLRAALTFTHLKRISGLDLPSLERHYLKQCAPVRYSSSLDTTPVGFLRYGRGDQVPRPAIYQWLAREWPEAFRVSVSPFFRILTIPSERDALTQFATELCYEGGMSYEIIRASLCKQAISTGLRYRSPVWLHPRDIARLADRQEIDALCLIVHCTKVNEGSPSELDCAKVAAAWLQTWCFGPHVHESAAKLLITVLREKVAGLRTILAEGSEWQSMSIDLNESCYKQPTNTYLQFLKMNRPGF